MASFDNGLTVLLLLLSSIPTHHRNNLSEQFMLLQCQILIHSVNKLSKYNYRIIQKENSYYPDFPFKLNPLLCFEEV